MRTLKNKLTSRKFLAAVVGVIAGLAMVFGLDEGTINNVAGAVTAAASIVTYILGEAKIDAASISASSENKEE